MIGTEIDPESVMLARANVKRNGLEKLIESELKFKSCVTIIKYVIAYFNFYFIQSF